MPITDRSFVLDDWRADAGLDNPGGMAGDLQGDERRARLDPVLRALDEQSLLDLAEAFDLGLCGDGTTLPGLILELLAEPEATAEEVVTELLDRRELDQVARALGLVTLPRRKAELAGRIMTALERPSDPVDPQLATPRRRGHARVSPKAGRRWRSFEAARAFARGLGLLDRSEWEAYCRGELSELFDARPADVPARPDNVYRVEGWAGYRDWLGIKRGRVHDGGWRPFRKARRFARGLGFTTRAQWLEYCRGEHEATAPLPSDVPTQPEIAYRGYGWRSWGDWLGAVDDHLRRTTRWRPFAEAREFARGLGLRRSIEWERYCKGEITGLEPLPDDVPRQPNRIYRTRGWNGFGDWLGTGVVGLHERSFRPYLEAREFACSLGLSSSNAWHAYVKGERRAFRRGRRTCL